MPESNAGLLAHVLLPLANEEDARLTATSLEPYDPERVTALHVVEKAGGGLDKTPVSFSEEVAEASFDIVRDTFPDAETRTVYAADIVKAIRESAAEADVTSIAFRGRGGNRLLQFLSGDRALKLISNAAVPVVVLPNE